MTATTWKLAFFGLAGAVAVREYARRAAPDGVYGTLRARLLAGARSRAALPSGAVADDPPAIVAPVGQELASRRGIDPVAFAAARDHTDGWIEVWLSDDPAPLR